MISSEWAVSRAVSHLSLVSEANFVAVQGLRAMRACKYGATRSYALAGLVQCRLCGRRMDSHWVNDRAGYRCCHGYNSSRARGREDALLSWLVRHFAPDQCRSEADAEPGVGSVRVK
jgi:hypothetical protein